MTVFEKLKARIKTDLGLDVENIKRTHAGRNMKASGAWTWIGNVVGSSMEVGSSTSASQLLDAKKIKKDKGWSQGQIEIIKDLS